LILAVTALVYALCAGLRTVSDFDVFWQMASGRWVAQHHSVFSQDLFSYTASGQPWIYPVGSGLLFYAAFLLGGYGLISWLGALACAGTIALLLRRASALTAALAIVAVPAIAARTSPRAEMFSVVLFAAFLSILWERFQTGIGKIWLLPLLMVAWGNLHLGFISGIGLACAYALAQSIRLLRVKTTSESRQAFKSLILWLAAILLATLLNPWDWGIYRALIRQQAAMAVHSELITEWAAIHLSFQSLHQAIAFRNPDSAALWLLMIAFAAALVAAFRRQWPTATLLAGSLWMTMQHVRFVAELACVVVIVAGPVFTAEFHRLPSRLKDSTLGPPLLRAMAVALIALAAIRSADLVTNRYYLGRDEISSFGAGLSWWFPDRAMAFVERENLPAQIFNTYEEGGFLLWRLGPRYKDFADGRAIPFGPDLIPRLQHLLQSPPDSPEWMHTADSYGIYTVVFPLARFSGLKYVAAALPSFCNSQDWRPVYLDEVSAVFVRRTPQTQPLIDRFPVDCDTAPLPTPAPSSGQLAEFNRWANASAVLLALGRNQEVVGASTRALSAFNQSAALWYMRATALLETGHPLEAERDLLRSAALEDRVATWSELADLYRSQKRYPAAVSALEHLALISPDKAEMLTALGYTCLEAQRPQDAIRAFDRVEGALPAGAANQALAEADNGRALAWSFAGDLRKATLFEEKAVNLVPQNPNYWSLLARFYNMQGRSDDALGAAERAAALTSGPAPQVP
jgi:tetratricopeptide (TPR) repeat protein